MPSQVSKQHMETMKAAEAQAKKGMAAFGSNAKFDLDADMAAMEQATVMAPGTAQKVAETQGPEPTVQHQEAAEETEEQLSDDPAVRLAQVHTKVSSIFPNVPSKETLAQWKGMHGDLFFLQLGDELLIYRYLKRQEWMQLNHDESWVNLEEAKRNEGLFARCVLFPVFQPHELLLRPAGFVDTVVQQIEMQSMFMDPVQIAANQTLKL